LIVRHRLDLLGYCPLLIVNLRTEAWNVDVGTGWASELLHLIVLLIIQIYILERIGGGEPVLWIRMVELSALRAMLEVAFEKVSSGCAVGLRDDVARLHARHEAFVANHKFPIGLTQFHGRRRLVGNARLVTCVAHHFVRRPLHVVSDAWLFALWLLKMPWDVACEAWRLYLRS